MESVSFTDPVALAAMAIAFVLGGILKGATGAGLPIIAVPIIASVYDVRLAVALMVIPNFLTNLTQVSKYRDHSLEPGFARNFASAGMVGAAVGTVLLAWLPVSTLQLLMAGIILGYIMLRLLWPDVQLQLGPARKLLWPAGFSGGVLQGAAGVSSPIAVTFLNAMRLARPKFIYTVSVYFAAMSVTQLIVLINLDLITIDIAVLGTLALIPLFIALPFGERIGQRISPEAFDRVILTALAALAIRMIWKEFI